MKWNYLGRLSTVGLLAAGLASAPIHAQQPSDQAPRLDPSRDVDAGQNQPEFESDRQQRASQQLPQRAGGRLILGWAIEPSENEEGLVVRGVRENGLAAQAGLQQEDRIVAVEGRQFSDPRELQQFLSARRGEEVAITIRRDGERQTLQLQLDPRGSEQGQRRGPGQPDQRPGDGQGGDAWLGVFMDRRDESEQGVRVVQVYPAGPAARAGLRPGDLIVAINEQPIQDNQDLVTIMDQVQPRSQLKLQVQRNDRELPLTVRAGSRNDFGQQQFGQRQMERMERDSDRAFFTRQPNDQDGMYDVPGHAMMMEAHRRLAEQHERIEQQIQQLREEVQALREMMSQQQRQDQ